jgi:hypothetical protein
MEFFNVLGMDVWPWYVLFQCLETRVGFQQQQLVRRRLSLLSAERQASAAAHSMPAAPSAACRVRPQRRSTRPAFRQ